jgi:hypothetical protein
MFYDCAKFGGFTAVFSSAYKVVLCLMRRWVTHNDRINAPIAGFLSAFSVAIETNSRKALFKILVLSRCIDSLINIADEDGYVPISRNLRYFLLWFIASGFVILLHVVRPELVNRGILGFYNYWSMSSKNERTAHFTIYETMWKGRAKGF